MARIVVTVRLDIDLEKLAAEYGDDRYATRRAAKEHIASDLREFLVAAPYADALSNIDVR